MCIQALCAFSVLIDNCLLIILSSVLDLSEGEVNPLPSGTPQPSKFSLTPTSWFSKSSTGCRTFDYKIIDVAAASYTGWDTD